jgi:hypothetical protein
MGHHPLISIKPVLAFLRSLKLALVDQISNRHTKLVVGATLKYCISLQC